MDSIPALWPITRGSSRSRAQRLFPSMMIATCSGGVGTWLTWDSLPLDLHDLGFFAGCHLVDERDEPVGDFLQLLTATPGFIGGNLLLLFQPFDPVHLLSPDVANRHVRVFRVALHEARVLPAALLIERWNRHADQLSVVAGIQAEFGLLNRLLDRADDRPVPGLNDDHARLGHGDRRQLVERHGIAVVLDRDLVDQGRAGTTGANRQDLAAQRFEALGHLVFGLFDIGLDHAGPPTIVPIDLPAIKPSRFPACERSKTMIGMLFSRHRVTAVWSITRRSLLIKSR